MVNFLKLEGPRGWFASEIAYVTALVVWVYYRLYERECMGVSVLLPRSLIAIRARSPLPRHLFCGCAELSGVRASASAL